MSAAVTWQGRYMSLTGALLRARRDCRMSQQVVAERMGIALRTFQRWESGQREPTAQGLFQWAAVVGVEITSRAFATERSPSEG
ncbi:helix-turn-helix domain-containing protein [Aureimonas frigidaquae]|uniref:helix-turn-helix domain-containing protein n=1 Tax=Aureimonas frigidaquae TaxID=424757 RepID=UPI000782B7F8|nr:helix-turn-helix transcriptional regulator [Aureimonas frigidaquae]